jgi:hypothetical protein
MWEVTTVAWVQIAWGYVPSVQGALDPIEVYQDDETGHVKALVPIAIHASTWGLTQELRDKYYFMFFNNFRELTLTLDKWECLHKMNWTYTYTPKNR